jgi:HAE1 family hydrophobic/amphiphilic exporter-1
MFLLVFVVFGALAFFDMSLNLMPDMELPFVSISTVYPGAGPKEIETQITNRIEDAVSTISGISYMISYSIENASIVIIAFDMEKNVDIANQEVKDKVDAIINNLPTDAMKPVVGKFDFAAMPVVRLVLSGHQSSLELYEFADKRLKDRLSQLEGVAQVDISGGQQREIHVTLDERTVFSNNISLTALSQILASQNMSLPAGSFTTGNQEISVKVVGEISSLQCLRDIEVPTAFGNRKLSQIATIEDIGSEVRERTTFYDLDKRVRQDNVISINLIKSADGNPVEISKGLDKQLESIRASLPDGMELTIVQENATFIEAAVNSTMGNIYLGIILTGLILLLFLSDLRSTLIVGLTMPIAIISTFVLMQLAGFSLNIMSLLGLSTSVGILVTNSILVLENIFRHKDMGKSKKESAHVGTSEIAVAVIAATLTNVVVFLPIATMSGILGSVFKEFGLTVTFATIFSLLIAFTLTPMLASIILPAKPKKNRMSQIVDGIMRRVETGYKKVLSAIMKNKKRSSVVLVMTIFLFIFSLYVFTLIGFDFMPTLDEGTINITVELPVGYSLQETANKLIEIEAIIARYPEVQFILTNLGASSGINRGTNRAQTTVQLVDAEKRSLSTQQLVDRLIRDFSHVAHARITAKAQSSAGGGGGSEISFFLMGSEDDVLVKLSEQVYDKLKDIPGLVNFDTSTRPGRPEITIEPRRDQLALTRNNVMEIALSVRAAIEGFVTTQYRELGNEYDIKVSLAEDAYNTPEKLRNLTIVTSRGTYQLSQLADIYFSESVNQIMHRDKITAINISGDTAVGVPLGVVTGEINRRLAEIDFPDGYRVQWVGSAEMMQEAIVEMGKAALLALLLLYMLLAAILESFRQPVLILSTIPLALIGVFFIQYITGLTMNIFSMMAIIMLIGIVVTNAILILDLANKHIISGMSVKEALLDACPTKLKPIIMTNIAIIIAMLPMAMGIGAAGREFRQAIGVVSVGGIIMSTMLTLFVTPALYYVTTKAKRPQPKPAE